MRMLHLLTLTAALGLVACGGDDPPTEYATFQLCVDDLKSPEGGAIDTKTAIAICIKDKTIGGMKLSFATKAECVTYVTANTTGFMANAIDQGCQMYINGI
ncbi:MAG: hypothetical protein R3B48_05050 [Kofleriaceae bacterium]